MKHKLLIFNLIVVTVALLTVFLSGISVNKSSHRLTAVAETKALAEAYKSVFEEKDIDNAVKDVPENVRVTFIDYGGKVLADSEGDISGNHLDREEIVAALKGEPKAVFRYSSSVKKEMVYYAEKIDLSDTYIFLRVSIPVASADDYVRSTIPTMIYVLIAAIFVCYIASILITNSLLKPIKDVKDKITAVKNGDYSPSIPRGNDEEINAMLSEINDVSERLKVSIEEARNDKERLDYILDNISDGIIVLDKDGSVERVNANAAAIFSVKNAEGKNYGVLTENEKFNSGVENCLKTGENSSFEVKTGGKIYMTSVKMLERGYAVIVLTDITAVKNSEKTRSEFFANASHELKTPLTAIKGFNDIIFLSTTDEKTKELSGKIAKETDRIVLLINDMLNLSNLEAERSPIKERVDLVKVCEDVKESLSSLAEQKKVTVEVSGSGVIETEKEHAVELVKNLTENAVRYNEAGGHVWLNVGKAGGRIVLTVKDDGIGIEDKDKERIFERFYRADKSRSREMGGTGLGLAIVKHICAVYNADLKLESKIGEGTTVTISFPE